MTLDEIALIAIAGLLAGAVNAVAGGGTFFSFPALLAVGLPPVIANASNAVALWPGSLAAAWAFRRELRRFRSSLAAMSLVALGGGLLGGLLLLATSNTLFTRLVPWLLLTATMLFACSDRLSTLTSDSAREAAGRGFGAGGHGFQFAVSVYGGFFGAGMGIVMLAALAIQGIHDIHELNALKNWLSALIYSVAVITFITAGAVSWPHTLVMLIASTFSSYCGARLAHRIAAVWLRRFIITIGAALTLYFFLT